MAKVLELLSITTLEQSLVIGIAVGVAITLGIILLYLISQTVSRGKDITKEDLYYCDQ